MLPTEEITKLERVVVGYILNNSSLYIANVQLFSRENLFRDANCRKVIDAYKKLTHDSATVDVIAIADESGLDITEIADYYQAIDYNIDFASAMSTLVTSQIEISMVQKLSETSKRIQQGDDIYRVISDFKEFLASNDTTPEKRISHVFDHIKTLINHMEKLTKGEISGIRTGLKALDEHTGGLQPSDLVIVAAETSQGKTALALTITYNIAVSQAAKVAVFSLEMSELQLTARLVAMETDISSKRLLFSPLYREEWELLNVKLRHLPEANIYIDDCRNSHIDYIIAGIKVAHMQYGIQVAVVDYLQLVKDPAKKSDESEVASNSRRLKNIAKELNITVILLSQLRRADNPRPTIGRLRGSGQIEESADVIALLWRPEYYGIQTYDTDAPVENTAGTAEVIIAKGRNYGVGRFWLQFNAALTKFTNLNTEDHDRTTENPPY